jgi:hypothetical protein
VGVHITDPHTMTGSGPTSIYSFNDARYPGRARSPAEFRRGVRTLLGTEVDPTIGERRLWDI